MEVVQKQKDKLPITNTIASADARNILQVKISNLYEVCKTATQSEIGWRMAFDGSVAAKFVFEGGQTYRRQYDLTRIMKALQTGSFPTVQKVYSNAIYMVARGQNDDRDIYEGEDGTPEGT